MLFKTDLFFIRLSLISSLLLTVLVVILNRATHNSLTGNLFLDFFPSIILVSGAWVFSKSKELPYALLLAARVSIILAFFGILYLYPQLYKEWRAGVYDKTPKSKTSQTIPGT